MANKSFIITVDTEGDAIWSDDSSRVIRTENTRYIPRFQELCEKYGFKPVYLTNYEMAMDDEWVAYSSTKANEGKCEIGMHLHAWNTPPKVSLPKRFNGLPYITEYPAEVIAEKVQTMMALLRDKYQAAIISHRAGRWATNDIYFEILAKHGIRIDCSFTPELDLSLLPGQTVSGGNDYRNTCKYTHILKSGIVEVPMTTRRMRCVYSPSLKRNVKTLIQGEDLWLRPIRKSEKQLHILTRAVEKEKAADYLEFMIHSSELMPGGSPYFKNEEEIELHYRILDNFFCYITKRGYSGKTLTEYVRERGVVQL